MSLSVLNGYAGERGRNNFGNGHDNGQQMRQSGSARSFNRSSASMSRPTDKGAAGRPGNFNSTGRPGNNGVANQPGNSGSAGGFRPGNNNRPGDRPGATTPSTRPGATTPGNNRPGSGTTTITRPGTTVPAGGSASHRPGTPNVRPSTPPPAPPTGPNHNSFRPGWSHRPERPHTPPSYGYYRPTPPPNWRPVGPVPNFNTILGVTLGTLLSNSVNYFYNNGYNVAGYTNNEVYLNNVTYANVMWPNATMYYRNGYLQGSVFSAATVGYDPTRYNYVYNYLAGQYGAPVSTSTLASGGMTSTWWGYDGRYVTLSFYPENVYGAGTRYFTTVSTGN